MLVSKESLSPSWGDTPVTTGPASKSIAESLFKFFTNTSGNAREGKEDLSG